MRTSEQQPRARLVRAALVTLLAATLLLPQAVSAQDLESAEQRRDELQARIAQTSDHLESLEQRIALTQEELAALETRAAELEAQAAEAGEALQVLARKNFMRGEMSTFESLLTSDGPQRALERARMLSALSRNDLAALQSSTALRVQIDQNRALMESKAQELAELEAQVEQQVAQLNQEFSHAQAIYQELKTRKDRQTQISRGAQNGTYACIFQGAYHFRNTWGAPRSGGRSHKGTDVMAPYGANVYAFTNGRVQRISSSGLGGLGLYLWGDDGIQYYYAHLKGIAPGVYAGKRVEAGQLVAYNGATGNASMSAPHVHFEVHPGGGGAVNPYHWLTPVC
ncbi:MAG: peptidoglycan DD-metalloendopeptidase family protein [Actinobacteria bacterium]|nr:peptidoglycan DD-metalloendopeptidase family protein [Actinomycetota bacterium]